MKINFLESRRELAQTEMSFPGEEIVVTGVVKQDDSTEATMFDRRIVITEQMKMLDDFPEFMKAQKKDMYVGVLLRILEEKKVL